MVCLCLRLRLGSARLVGVRLHGASTFNMPWWMRRVPQKKAGVVEEVEGVNKQWREWTTGDWRSQDKVWG